MAQHRRAQAKNTEFVAIKEGLNEIQYWITKNIDTPTELLCITEWERNINYTALNNFQQDGEKV
jgi:hypothetical protein